MLAVLRNLNFSSQPLITVALGKGKSPTIMRDCALLSLGLESMCRTLASMLKKADLPPSSSSISSTDELQALQPQ